MKTFKTKVYLNREAIQYCKRAFGVRRCIWNWAIAQCLEEKKKPQHKRPSNFALDKLYREHLKAQADKSFVWLAKQQTSPRLMQEVLKDVEQSFKLAIKAKGRNARPHFKTRKDRLQTFRVARCSPADFKITGDKTLLFTGGASKRQRVRTRESLAFLNHDDVKICTLTITCIAGEYWMSVAYEKHNRTRQKPSPNSVIGLDLGVVKSVCAYDGHKTTDVSFNTKHSLKLDRLAKSQDEHMSRQIYGSKRYEKQLLLKQKRAAKAARIRTNELEKYTSFLAENYERIVVDDFTFKNALAVANHEDLYRCMKYQFKFRLQQKAAETGAEVVFVPHQKGVRTTHVCSNCGSIKVHTNSQRQFHCFDCGFVSDRDVNAAINAYNFK